MPSALVSAARPDRLFPASTPRAHRLIFAPGLIIRLITGFVELEPLREERRCEHSMIAER
jgi:hypothetical protein